MNMTSKAREGAPAGAGGVVSNSNGNQFGSILCHPKPTTSTSESPPLQLQLASSTLGSPIMQLVQYQLLSRRNFSCSNKLIATDSQTHFVFLLKSC